MRAVLGCTVLVPQRIAIIILGICGFMSIVGANEAGFAFHVQATPSGFILAADPPSGFKLNRQYPNSIRVLSSAAETITPDDPMADKATFTVAAADKSRIEIYLGYCSKSICRLDHRFFMWEKASAKLVASGPAPTARNSVGATTDAMAGARPSSSATTDGFIRDNLPEAFRQAKTMDKINLSWFIFMDALVGSVT